MKKILVCFFSISSMLVGCHDSATNPAPDLKPKFDNLIGKRLQLAYYDSISGTVTDDELFFQSESKMERRTKIWQRGVYPAMDFKNTELPEDLYWEVKGSRLILGSQTNQDEFEIISVIDPKVELKKAGNRTYQGFICPNDCDVNPILIEKITPFHWKFGDSLASMAGFSANFQVLFSGNKIGPTSIFDGHLPARLPPAMGDLVKTNYLLMSEGTANYFVYFTNTRISGLLFKLENLPLPNKSDTLILNPVDWDSIRVKLPQRPLIQRQITLTFSQNDSNTGPSDTCHPFFDFDGFKSYDFAEAKKNLDKIDVVFLEVGCPNNRWHQLSALESSALDGYSELESICKSQYQGCTRPTIKYLPLRPEYFQNIDDMNYEISNAKSVEGTIPCSGKNEIPYPRNWANITDGKTFSIQTSTGAAYVTTVDSLQSDRVDLTVWSESP